MILRIFLIFDNFEPHEKRILIKKKSVLCQCTMSVKYILPFCLYAGKFGAEKSFIFAVSK